ncbi:gasdermin-E-like [Denticeps clupeoides]|uniref:gasdermin-E-like n=1 Tax=Denticeps clupeoides TaxID=299321 RepID=UPI0010A314D7|nr:gasdermin-E-like [Denticeps clupeoides]
MFSGLQRGTCSAVLRALGSRSIQVSVSESTSVQLDSDVSMEIPPNTVLAYSVIDLLIKENGNYEFCLQPEVQGGFASGRTSRRSWVDEVDHGDGARVEPDQEIHGAGIPLVNIQQQLMQVKIDLQHLCCLVDSTRSDLLHLLTSLLPDHVLSLDCGWRKSWMIYVQVTQPAYSLHQPAAPRMAQPMRDPRVRMPPQSGPCICL